MYELFERTLTKLEFELSEIKKIGIGNETSIDILYKNPELEVIDTFLVLRHFQPWKII